jgi:hypothetical protein
VISLNGGEVGHQDERLVLRGDLHDVVDIGDLDEGCRAGGLGRELQAAPVETAPTTDMSHNFHLLKAELCTMPLTVGAGNGTFCLNILGFRRRRPIGSNITAENKFPRERGERGQFSRPQAVRS